AQRHRPARQRRPLEPAAGEAPARRDPRRLPPGLRARAPRRLPLGHGDGGRALRALLAPQGGAAAHDGRACRRAERRAGARRRDARRAARRRHYWAVAATGVQTKRVRAIASPTTAQRARTPRSLQTIPTPWVAGSNAWRSPPARCSTGKTFATSRSQRGRLTLGMKTPEMK